MIAKKKKKKKVKEFDENGNKIKKKVGKDKGEDANSKIVTMIKAK